jgi:hypothetical protein
MNQRPVFNPADSFAAFDKSSMSATEEAGVVKIPVTIASIDPIATTVTYTVDTENSTAVEGTHFNLVDPSAVLSFANDARTAYIELEIIPVRGEAGYTGDKVIYLELTGSNDVNMGSNKVCKFTINDLDHPLSAILGEYTLTDGSTTKTITIEKDAKDVTVVHFPDIMSGVSTWLGPEYSFDIIGQVSKDMSTIVIPLPVDTGYKYSNGESLMIYQGNASSVFFTGSSVTLTATATGFSSGEFGLVGYIKNAGWVEWIDPFTITKK